MGISLNNHESRIKALENGGAGSWSKGSNANGNWVKESKTGLLIQWGRTVMQPGDHHNVTQSFPLEFESQPSVFVQFIGNTPDNFWANNVQIYGVTTSKFTHARIWIMSPHDTYGRPWLAIGYLISYRILNYAYACKSLLFTPLRTTGGVK